MNRGHGKPQFAESPWIRIQILARLVPEGTVQAKLLRAPRTGPLIDTGIRVDVYNPPGADTFPANYKGFARHWPDANRWEIVGCHCEPACACDFCEAPDEDLDCGEGRSVSGDHAGAGFAMTFIGGGHPGGSISDALANVGHTPGLGTCTSDFTAQAMLCLWGGGPRVDGGNTWGYGLVVYRTPGGQLRAMASANLFDGSFTTNYEGDDHAIPEAVADGDGVEHVNCAGLEITFTMTRCLGSGGGTSFTLIFTFT